MLKTWFRNTSKKAIGVQGTRTSHGGMLGSVVRTGKRGRVHKPEEIYQSMFKEKIDALMKVEKAKYYSGQGDGSGSENPDSLDKGDDKRGSDDSDTDDNEDVDGEGQGRTPSGGHKEKGKAVDKGSKQFKSWQMSTRRRVVREAWEAEPDEVKDLVNKKVELEKRKLAELNDDEKEGLERTPEQRQLYV